MYMERYSVIFLSDTEGGEVLYVFYLAVYTITNRTVCRLVH